MGSAEEVASDVAFFKDLGGSVLVFNFLSPAMNETLEKMERYAKEVLSL